MSSVKLMVLYPMPTDIDQFETDYQAHLSLLHHEMQIPEGERPYRVTKMLSSPQMPAKYYLQFSFRFPSHEDLKKTLGSPQMQRVAADADRISTGGSPVVLIGTDD